MKMKYLNREIEKIILKAASRWFRRNSDGAKAVR